jgi:hypothetical protein
MSAPIDPTQLQRAIALQADLDRQARSWQGLHLGGRLLILVLGVLTAGVVALRGSAGLEAWRLPLQVASVIMPLLAIGLVGLLSLYRPGRRWVAYRSGAEAVKVEAFLYATESEKYQAEEAGIVFGRRLQEIEDLVTELLRPPAFPPPPPAAPAQVTAGGMPSAGLTPEAYVVGRVRDQECWYRRRSAQMERRQILLAGLVALAMLAAAGLGWWGLGPWVAVMTTVVGALSTFAALTAASFLASSYRGTAERLARLAGDWRAGAYGDAPDAFSRFVVQVEQIIAREHSGWVAVFSHVSHHHEGPLLAGRAAPKST